mgnify:CR=1 FL=1
MIRLVPLLLILFIAVSAGCSEKVKSSEEALEIAKSELSEYSASRSILEGDFRLISITENQGIDGWEIYFENSNKNIRLNILVGRNGSSEVHMMKK